MVIARYGVPGLATGTLGVLGPMRMSYAKTIPTVRYVAGLLSDLVNDAILVNKLTYVIARSRWLRRKRQTRRRSNLFGDYFRGYQGRTGEKV